MDKDNFFKILCEYTPQELNKLISSKGKIKSVNAVTFIEDQELVNKEIEYYNNSIKEQLKNLNR